jgi:hypothetical protein
MFGIHMFSSLGLRLVDKGLQKVHGDLRLSALCRGPGRFTTVTETVLAERKLANQG